jgi:hypothetical protein
MREWHTTGRDVRTDSRTDIAAQANGSPAYLRTALNVPWHWPPSVKKVPEPELPRNVPLKCMSLPVLLEVRCRLICPELETRPPLGILPFAIKMLNVIEAPALQFVPTRVTSQRPSKP